MNISLAKTRYQKQPSRGVLRKRCSENMQQIYRRTSMPKCDFNKVALNYAANLLSVKLLYNFIEIVYGMGVFM